MLQKNGGRLGETGSTTHLFKNCGIIHLDKKKCNINEMFEIATNFGAKDFLNLENCHEIITEKEDFYNVKSELEKKTDSIVYSSIEWRPLAELALKTEQKEKVLEILYALEELDDIQNIYTNAKMEKIRQ